MMLRLSRKLAVAVAAGLALLLLVNVGLNLAFFVATDAGGRATLDAGRLQLSGPQLQAQPADTFNRLYSEAIARDPPLSTIRARFQRELETGGPIVFDLPTAAYAVDRAGQVDARVLPAGLYLGTRAIGPDKRPQAVVTKYLAHYGLYARHSFILVVPARRPDGGYDRAMSFAAGLERDFLARTPQRMQLYATLHPYARGGFDFPNEGQAIHELFLLSADPAVVAGAPAKLRHAALALQAADMDYRLIRQNSNTVIGCLLRASGVLGGREEAILNDWRIGLRALGIDFDLPLRSKLPDAGAWPRLARDCHD